MRRTLQILLGGLAVIPLFFGLMNLLGGAGRFLSDEVVTSAMDSQFRFQSAWYLGLVGLIIWIIPRIERERAVFTIIVLSLFIGGLGRAYAWATIGPPPMGMKFGMVLELALPILLIFQARIARP